MGHRHPDVVNVVKHQVDKLLNYAIAYFYGEKLVKLAKILTEISPGDYKKK